MRGFVGGTDYSVQSWAQYEGNVGPGSVPPIFERPRDGGWIPGKRLGSDELLSGDRFDPKRPMRIAWAAFALVPHTRYDLSTDTDQLDHRRCCDFPPEDAWTIDASMG
jgi:hypothetical protein